MSMCQTLVFKLKIQLLHVLASYERIVVRLCHMVRGCLDLEKSIQFILPKKSTFATIELFYVEKISDFVDVNSI